MKKLLLICLPVFCAVSFSANAGELKNISIQDALNSDEAKKNLPDDIKYYFGDAKPAGTVTKTIGQYTFQKDVNGSLKSAINGCHTALVTVLRELREAAKKDGANAVVNIVTNSKGKAVSSKEMYACDSGMLKSSVTITGDLVVVE